MSHELRTPLNAIIGFSGVLKDGLLGEMKDEHRRFIGDIFNSGKHLLSLINDILDMSKVEDGKMTLDLEPVPVSSLFANSLSLIKETAATRKIHVTMDAADQLGSIQVDARKVRQVVYNLLSNAAKFTVEGGQVTLRDGRVPPAVSRPLGSASYPAPGQPEPSPWPTTRSRSFSRSASPTTVSACRRRRSNSCSSPSLRSTAV